MKYLIFLILMGCTTLPTTTTEIHHARSITDKQAYHQPLEESVRNWVLWQTYDLP
jgi:hypothetical protein